MGGCCSSPPKGRSEYQSVPRKPQGRVLGGASVSTSGEPSGDDDPRERALQAAERRRREEDRRGMGEGHSFQRRKKIAEEREKAASSATSGRERPLKWTVDH
eukprot:TRINITY_DN1378_c0_g1_i1.p1 TRINITY_DN1378_c0_g1~~TRINITY_DN1378_c0_g1_i1.p1  ORF type:complete len:102 (-),score=39.03 TRINITY_DN1378_c0_g1_i1:643-948(-)